jgi:hypothetical protein
MTMASARIPVHQWDPPPRRRAVAGAVLVCTVAGVSAAILAATGNPVSALTPVAVAVGATLLAYMSYSLPLRYTLFAFSGLVILADIAPSDLSSDPAGVWKSPVYLLHLLLIDNLDTVVGVDALRFSGTELVLLLLLILVAVRGASGYGGDRAGRIGGANVVKASLALAGIAIAALEVRGIASGGDVRQSLWQFRWLVWLPVITALVMYALRGPRDFATWLYVITATACVKAAIGLYYYLAVARPAGVRPATVTSHIDSLLFVVVIALWVGVVVYRPTVSRFAIAAAISGWMVMAIVINNRRTAYVGLAATLIVLCPLLTMRLKRLLAHASFVCVPLVAVYLAAGSGHTTGFFAPAGSIMSVFEARDASTATRDVENYNLILTLKPHILAGTGWGHEYVEAVKAFDISRVFAQYRYLAHNSVLWLLGIGGVLGFTAIWLPMQLAVFMASRSNRFARTGDERAAAYGVVAIIACYATLAWADIGTQSWTTDFLLAGAIAGSSKLATATGAWPAGIRLLSRRGVRRQVHLGSEA